MFLLGACSSDSNEDNVAEESTTENAEELTIEAFNWEFALEEYTVPAGGLPFIYPTKKDIMVLRLRKQIFQLRVMV